MSKRKYTGTLLRVDVDILNYEKAVANIINWAQSRASKYVCVSNVHMMMEGWDNREFRRVMNAADMLVPDGMPLAWGLRRLGYCDTQRVRGPDLMLALCEKAAIEGVSIGLYGGREEASDKLQTFLLERFPGLNIDCFIIPPFRPITPEENAGYIQRFNESSAGLVFVGVGCPKQELWMSQNRGALNATMVGVGAAFDIFSGLTPEAPHWMQRAGLEWVFRFVIEPKRLWKRYLKHNPRFVFLFALQWLAKLFGKKIFQVE